MSNLVDCDEKYCPFKGLFVGRSFGSFALKTDRETVSSVVEMASDLLFLCSRSQEDALKKVLVLLRRQCLIGYQLIVT